MVLPSAASGSDMTRTVGYDQYGSLLEPFPYLEIPVSDLNTPLGGTGSCMPSYPVTDLKMSFLVIHLKTAQRFDCGLRRVSFDDAVFG